MNTATNYNDVCKWLSDDGARLMGTVCGVPYWEVPSGAGSTASRCQEAHWTEAILAISGRGDSAWHRNWSRRCFVGDPKSTELLRKSELLTIEAPATDLAQRPATLPELRELLEFVRPGLTGKMAASCDLMLEAIVDHQLVDTNGLCDSCGSTYFSRPQVEVDGQWQLGDRLRCNHCSAMRLIIKPGETWGQYHARASPPDPVETAGA